MNIASFEVSTYCVTRSSHSSTDSTLSLDTSNTNIHNWVCVCVYILYIYIYIYIHVNKLFSSLLFIYNNNNIIISTSTGCFYKTPSHVYFPVSYVLPPVGKVYC